MDMASLIAVVQHDVYEELAEHGPDEEFPVSAGGVQKFEYDLGDGIGLLVQNANTGRHFTWEVMRDVLVGLRIYLIEGRRFRQTYFNFWTGAELWPLGSGSIHVMESGVDQS